MAERRAIKTSIWDDEFFGELDILPRLVWIGLFSKLADDQGRFLDNPALICSKLFPYGGVTIDQVEQCLIAFDGHIIRYEVAGKRYIQIRKWWENQPLQYAVPSNMPAPQGWKDMVRTYYKGIKIVYNWPGLEDTAEGSSLMTQLGGLGRVSTWMDYVGPLNLNPNPIPNPNPNDDDARARDSEIVSVDSPWPVFDASAPRDPVIVAFDNAWPGSITGASLMMLDKARAMYTDPWVIEAIDDAVKHGAKSFSYADKILQTWKSTGQMGGSARDRPRGNHKMTDDEFRAAMNAEAARLEKEGY